MSNRYFIDERIGVILVIDGSVHEKEECVQSYPDDAVILRINGIRDEIGEWVIPLDTRKFCEYYIKCRLFLEGEES